jgi:molybdopterin molybdotransferase
VSAPLLDPELAVALVLERVAPQPAEPVALDEALGRVLAADAIARHAVPPFDNSAMDGYALRSADASAPPATLRIAGESRAGRPAASGPGPGEAVRISTGAQLPADADAVVALEDAAEDGDRVRLERSVASGAHVRRAGDDVAAGDRVVAAGTRLGAAELGVLASVGVAAPSCARRPALALLTTGDELVAAGRSLAPGQIHDATAHSLRALALGAGAEVVAVETLRDDPDATEAALAAALGADVVVVCGGVSVGRHDHVKDALARLGVEQLFWRVALKPGKPTWFGVADRAADRPALVFGLPGNPVSAMVTFHVFVRPALRAALGLVPREPRLTATLAAPYAKVAGRVEYVRCRLERDAGGLRAWPTRPAQGSHVLTSMLGADGLAVLAAERKQVAAGELVDVELLPDRSLA